MHEIGVTSGVLRPFEGLRGPSGGMRTMIATLVATAALTGTAQAAPLNWTPCDDGFECATAQVPLDYDKPAGQRSSSR